METRPNREGVDSKMDVDHFELNLEELNVKLKSDSDSNFKFKYSSASNHQKLIVMTNRINTDPDQLLSPNAKDVLFNELVLDWLCFGNQKIVKPSFGNTLLEESRLTKLNLTENDAWYGNSANCLRMFLQNLKAGQLDVNIFPKPPQHTLKVLTINGTKQCNRIKASRQPFQSKNEDRQLRPKQACDFDDDIWICPRYDSQEDSDLPSLNGVPMNSVQRQQLKSPNIGLSKKRKSLTADEAPDVDKSGENQKGSEYGLEQCRATHCGAEMDEPWSAASAFWDSYVPMKGEDDPLKDSTNKLWKRKRRPRIKKQWSFYGRPLLTSVSPPGRPLQDIMISYQGDQSIIKKPEAMSLRPRILLPREVDYTHFGFSGCNSNITDEKKEWKPFDPPNTIAPINLEKKRAKSYQSHSIITPILKLPKKPAHNLPLIKKNSPKLPPKAPVSTIRELLACPIKDKYGNDLIDLTAMPVPCKKQKKITDFFRNGS